MFDYANSLSELYSLITYIIRLFALFYDGTGGMSS